MSNISQYDIELIATDDFGRRSLGTIPAYDKLVGLNDKARSKLRFLEQEGLVTFEQVPNPSWVNWQKEGF